MEVNNLTVVTLLGQRVGLLAGLPFVEVVARLGDPHDPSGGQVRPQHRRHVRRVGQVKRLCGRSLAAQVVP
ncbi:MAG: hypothetical protein AAF711_05005 [Planctomycetota bacterium]